MSTQHLVTELCIIPKSMYVDMTSLPSAVLGRHMMVVAARKGEHYFQELPKYIESQVNGLLFLFRDSELYTEISAAVCVSCCRVVSCI